MARRKPKRQRQARCAGVSHVFDVPIERWVLLVSFQVRRPRPEAGALAVRKPRPGAGALAPFCAHSPALLIASVYHSHAFHPPVYSPITMTFAATPALESNNPGDEFIESLVQNLKKAVYDHRDLPLQDKTGATCGMSLTEKQGGSDVRANTTLAQKEGGLLYRIIGHKWFTSAPMSDAFLTLSQVEGAGLTCFIVPRHLPTGGKNTGFQLQRLKEKMGDKSNVSAL